MFCHLLVHLQQFDGVPSLIADIRIFFPKLSHDYVDLVFNLVFVHHGVLFVMVVHMGRGFSCVVVDERSLLGILAVVGNGMHKDRKPCLLTGRHRNRRYSQHLRKAVEVNLHATFFHDVHHIQRQYNRFAKFDKLQRKI